jgi:hypothetical protein
MADLANEAAWVVVHPKGDTSEIALRDVRSMKKRDAIVVHTVYSDMNEAIATARELAGSHGLNFMVDPRIGGIELERTDGQENGVFYVVVKKGEDAIAVACAQWFDIYDYRYAHPNSFAEEKDADAMATLISNRFGLEYDSEFEPESPGY